jgi:hypothetical protein
MKLRSFLFLLFSSILLSVQAAPPLSNQQIIDGLREALTIGTNTAGASASKTDGFNKNQLIRIPFPKEATEMKKTLEGLGMSKQVNAFETQLNRAAEDAAKKAAPIFLDAIKKMTITDGLTILQGKQDEATQYLRKNTSSNLTTAFRPVINESLQKVQITSYWSPLMKKYNRIPGVKKQNPDLAGYVTQKAIDGMFVLIAQEEGKIRKDPAAQITNLLQLVFGR